MVMGRTHALHGATAGFLASHGAALAGMPMTPGLALLAAGLGAGAAIAPDLDHEGATASRALGPITWAASAGIRAISAVTYRATMTLRDRRNDDGHRGVTHTVPGALAMGAFFGGIPALAGLASPAAGLWTSLAVVWLFLVWALRALPPINARARDYLTATVLTAGAWWVLDSSYTGPVPLLLGAIIALGCVVHSIGDGLTDYGVPLAWPLVIRGQRWYSCGSPRPLRFKAGKAVEDKVVFPASVVLVFAAALLAFPGAYGFLGEMISGAWSLAFA